MECENKRVTILVEPLLFNSRLQICKYLTNSLISKGSVCIISNKNYETEHFNEIFKSLRKDVTFVKCDCFNNLGKYRQLSFKEVRILSKVIVHTINNKYKGFDINLLYCAVDDYPKFWPYIAFYVSAMTKGIVKSCAIKYRAEGVLFDTKMTIPYFIKKALFCIPTNTLGIKTIVFDERCLSIKNVEVIPDPWSNDNIITDKLRLISDYSLPHNNGGINVLLIGYQDQRKGIEFFIDYLEKDESKKFNFIVVGNIAVEYKEVFERIKIKKENLIHIDKFVTEKEMLSFFDYTDVVLLPYHPNFKSSSGVLIRSVLFGKPVVTTSHGLVGYRTKMNCLGVVVRYGDVECLSNAINKAFLSSNENRESKLRFVNENSLASFDKKIRKIV
ncbi:Glycosyl transferases group 1 [Serratia fonticola]|uniref:glycosyltransferase n=1 Tax=Serratia fonticola TaxID=47917 RepID=UPI00217AD041|nr:glycosyltransferase [Serratia fonticola]CAI1766888.1 Glycosyl transferases group 1 [Serratia fonticola]